MPRSNKLKEFIEATPSDIKNKKRLILEMITRRRSRKVKEGR